MSYWKKVWLGCLFLVASAICSSAQTLTVLASFGDQFTRFTSFVQGRDGNLYGTVIDFNNGSGSVLKLTPSGTLIVLHNFCTQVNCRDGANPVGSLALGTDGNFYGVANGGGNTSGSCTSYGCGIVFRITPAGVYSVLHYFSGSDGSNPGGLIEGSDRNFYGTAGSGGSGSLGTIFKMTVAGAITTLHNFNESDGLYPTGLVQGTDDALYGTASEGGKYTLSSTCEAYNHYGCGTVFKITTGGAFTLLHSFDVRAEGAEPYVSVVQANDGTFYGTTSYGKGWGDGTVFSITSDGVFTTVYQFVGIAAYPTVGLFPASDGNLYGTIGSGLSCGGGQIFSISLAGQYTTVYDSCVAGGYTDTVVQATSGRFYGTYQDFAGILYSLDTGLGPFVGFVLPSGRTGQTAQILSQGLTGTTSVTFNGVPTTSFKVVSDTYMTAVVPAGATTGAVVVATPAGNLTSNVSFRVTR